MLGRRHLLLLGIFVASLFAVAALAHRRALALREEAADADRHVTIPSPSAARIMSLGYTEMAADIAWVRMLVYYGNGLVHDNGMPDTEALVRLVNVLDPQFRKVYTWGAYATTMRQGMATDEEYQSSVDILRRGIQVFPNDWELSWILGIRLFLEMKGGTDEEKARRKEEGVMYIERAMHNPKAPKDLPLLAASLRTQLGQKEQALRDLQEMILNTEDDKAREILIARYRGLASETATNELADAAKEFDREWDRLFPYAPATVFVLLGAPPSPGVDLEKIVRGETLDDGATLAPSAGE